MNGEISRHITSTDFKDEDGHLTDEKTRLRLFFNILPKLSYIDVILVLLGIIAFITYVLINIGIESSTDKDSYIVQLTVQMYCATLVMIGATRIAIIILRRIVQGFVYLIDGSAQLPTTIVLYSLDPTIYNVIHSAVCLSLFHPVILSGSFLYFNKVSSSVNWNTDTETPPRVALLILRIVLVWTLCYFVGDILIMYFSVVSFRARASNMLSVLQKIETLYRLSAVTNMSTLKLNLFTRRQKPQGLKSSHSRVASISRIFSRNPRINNNKNNNNNSFNPSHRVTHSQTYGNTFNNNSAVNFNSNFNNNFTYDHGHSPTNSVGATPIPSSSFHAELSPTSVTSPAPETAPLRERRMTAVLLHDQLFSSGAFDGVEGHSRKGVCCCKRRKHAKSSNSASEFPGMTTNSESRIGFWTLYKVVNLMRHSSLCLKLDKHKKLLERHRDVRKYVSRLFDTLVDIAAPLQPFEQSALAIAGNDKFLSVSKANKALAMLKKSTNGYHPNYSAFNNGNLSNYNNNSFFEKNSLTVDSASWRMIPNPILPSPQTNYPLNSQQNQLSDHVPFLANDKKDIQKLANLNNAQHGEDNVISKQNSHLQTSASSHQIRDGNSLENLSKFISSALEQGNLNEKLPHSSCDRIDEYDSIETPKPSNTPIIQLDPHHRSAAPSSLPAPTVPYIRQVIPEPPHASSPTNRSDGTVIDNHTPPQVPSPPPTQPLLPYASSQPAVNFYLPPPPPAPSPFITESDLEVFLRAYPALIPIAKKMFAPPAPPAAIQAMQDLSAGGMGSSGSFQNLPSGLLMSNKNSGNSGNDLQMMSNNNLSVLSSSVTSKSTSYGFEVDRRRFLMVVHELLNDKKAQEKSISSQEDVAEVVAQVCRIFCAFIWILVSLIILGVDPKDFLVSSATVLASLAFVFGNSAKNFLDSLVFVFFQAPFSIGERVKLLSFRSEQTLIVKKQAALITTFETVTGERVVVPNFVLAATTIINHNRSTAACHYISFQVCSTTSVEVVRRFQDDLTAFLNANSHYWATPATPTVNIDEMKPGQYTTIGIWCQHVDPWFMWRTVYTAKTELLGFISGWLMKENISFALPEQPVRMYGDAMYAPQNPQFGSHQNGAAAYLGGIHTLPQHSNVMGGGDKFWGHSNVNQNSVSAVRSKLE